MKTEDLIIGKTYFYKGIEVIYKGETNNGMTFWEFETESTIPVRLWEHEVNELITEIK